jgi:hypothetical protein
VVSRYCGTSNKSIDILDLLYSIIIHIFIVYQLQVEMKDFNESLSKSHQRGRSGFAKDELDASYKGYANLLKMFHKLLLEYPIYLFIDSLDQLSNQFEARSQLAFLQHVKLHPSSRIIVSCLPDEWIIRGIHGNTITVVKHV